MSAPPYLARPSEQAFAPPYCQAGCALYGFALPAEQSRLSALVERFIVAPSKGSVRARVEAEHVLLYFCDFARSSSLAPPERGWLGERECGIWIPLLLPGHPQPTFMVHSMFVDSGPAMVSGREVLGFPKQIGAVSVEREPARAGALSLDVLAFGESREVAGRWLPLLEFERTQAKLDPGVGPLAHALGLGAELLGSRSHLELAARVLRARAQFLNLKQFRDAAHPELACYQAVIRCQAQLLRLRRVAASSTYHYRIHDLSSHPLARELGLPTEGLARGIACELDFELSAGQELEQ